ncbi:MAG: adenylate/guanylate cyclase domain-containing protein [Patescibacteria group bacterium]|nr:adenylate/guanylate cyclase domain-containing protein [Patescibacteria group bacterium]
MKRWLYALVLASVIAGIFSLLFLSGFFSTWQERASDSLFLQTRSRPEIIIVGIDDKSIQQIGRWPWNREYHARLLEILGTRPAVIGYDVAFSEPSEASADARLATAFGAASTSFVPVEGQGFTFTSEPVPVQRVVRPISAIEQVTGVGVVNTIASMDSITRHIPLRIITPEGEVYEHFSLRVARAYQSKKGIIGGFRTIPLEDGLMRINFSGPPRSYRTVPFIDVLNGTIPPSEFDGKIVLVGATAVNLRDNQVTAVSGREPMMGVEILANSIQTILEERFLQIEPQWHSILQIWLLAIAVAAAMSMMRLVYATIVTILLAVLHLLFAFYSFDSGVVRNITFPMLVVSVTYSLLSLYRALFEYNQRVFLKRAFSLYLAPPVLEQILRNPDQLRLGGEKKTMTVFFADIVGFTSLSERLPPDELSALLNAYLTRVSKIIFANGGVIDKFIGDAIMAFWNAPLTDPEHALNACRAALGVEKEVEEISQEWKHKNLDGFSVRIGINTGEMVVGNMGSEMRFDYTVIGDSVNMASRLEGINREYGTKILISGGTYRIVANHVVARKIDRVALKGKRKGDDIYELVRIGKPTAAEQIFFLKYEKALSRYQKGDFHAALNEFSSLAKEHPEDKPVRVLIARCTQFISSPPPNWDGIYYSTVK